MRASNKNTPQERNCPPGVLMILAYGTRPMRENHQHNWAPFYNPETKLRFASADEVSPHPTYKHFLRICCGLKCRPRDTGAILIAIWSPIVLAKGDSIISIIGCISPSPASRHYDDNTASPVAPPLLEQLEPFKKELPTPFTLAHAGSCC